MLMTTNLRRQHAKILAITDELGVLSAPSQAAAVRTLLAQLHGLMSMHLAMEDRSLYPELSSHHDTSVRELAKQFQSEMGGLGRSYFRFSERWSLSGAIEANPAEFTRALQELVGTLRRRIQREDSELYPLLEKSGA